MTQTKPKNKFQTTDVFMASAMAFRINGDYVNSWVQDPTSEEVKAKPLNKDIMREHFVSGNPQLTEQDQEVGQLMYGHFKGILLKKLTKQLNQFENAIAELVIKDEVSRFEFGLIASLAKVYHRDLKSESARESIASIGFASQFIESTTATAGNFFLDVNILTTLRLPAYNCWTVTAKTKENNLVGFYMKQDPAPYMGKDIEIRCRVKDRKQSRDGFNVTYLNYVKLLSEEV
jgi:hypothetical protein